MRGPTPPPAATTASKPDILFLLHLPPPVHGSSVVGQQIRTSARINDAFHCRFLNLLASRQLQSSGKFTAGKLIGFARTALELSRLLAARRPDAVYLALTTTGFAFFRDALLVALVKLARIPCVLHLHNKGVGTKQSNPLYRSVYGFVFRSTNVLLLSRRLQPDIAAFVAPEQVFVCPNGIPDQRGPGQRSAPDARVPRVLFLSNLMTTKGVVVLLQACALLERRGIAFHCTLVGTEGDISATSLKSQVDELGLRDRVTYVGPRHGEEKNAEFRSADIFVLPTFNECFPLVVLEAMQFGLPVVSCPEGGIADQVIDGETGYLVPQRDAMALADRLAVLVADPMLCATMGRRGRQRYEERFTAEQWEERFVRVLATAAGVSLPAAQPPVA